MSYALEPDESLPAGLRRIADEQVGRALESLRRAAEDREQADGGIHDARKRFKKVRAVLRLVRKEIGDVYDRENVAYRDAGRLLSEVRESSVAPETVRALLDRHRGLLEEERFEAYVTALEERHSAILDGVRGPGEALEEATTMAEKARERIPSWPVPDHEPGGMAASLHKVYRRGWNRMADAYDDPSGPRFHEWRKRAKYLWYHLRILAPAWPHVLEPWADAQHDLTDLLGEGNDLSDLLGLLQEEPGLLPDPEVADVLAGLAGARREDLWESARPLGRRLYAEEPDAFVERVTTYRDGREPVSPGQVLLGI